MSTAARSIAIIVGSQRTPRVGPKVADWIKSTLEKSQAADKKVKLEFSLVDMADFRLPIFDEQVMPANVPERAQLANSHSKAWSEAIKKYDGYVLVSPEYNYGIPGGVKNAIDYLSHEWKGKPIAIVTYTIFGSKNASDQLNQVLSGMGLRVAATRPSLAFHGNVGPEFFAAAGAGELGPNTIADWDREQAAELAKAADEVGDLLAAPPVVQPVGA